MSISIKELENYVNDNIIEFHNNKLSALKKLNLNKIIRAKNPYLFRAKNILIASDLVTEILDAYLSSSEEKIFGDFLEGLAIFIANKTYNGRKSSAQGIDLEINKGNVHHLISIKSGTSWGNSSQQKKQQQDFQIATRVLKQSNHTLNVESILGICYGKTKTSFTNGCRKVVGQNFWYFLSGNQELYKEIIVPIGYKAKEHNFIFDSSKSALTNQLTEQFIKNFCENGVINWEKVIEFNSGNLVI